MCTVYVLYTCVIQGCSTGHNNALCVVDVPEELLSSVADKLSGKFFRAGVLLNIQPHELDRIEVHCLFHDLRYRVP